MWKAFDVVQKILQILTFGKIKTKNQLTTFAGYLIGLVMLILNITFDVKLDIEQQQILNSVIITLLFMFWHPEELTATERKELREMSEMATEMDRELKLRQ